MLLRDNIRCIIAILPTKNNGSEYTENNLFSRHSEKLTASSYYQWSTSFIVLPQNVMCMLCGQSVLLRSAAVAYMDKGGELKVPQGAQAASVCVGANVVT